MTRPPKSRPHAADSRFHNHGGLLRKNQRFVTREPWSRAANLTIGGRPLHDSFTRKRCRNSTPIKLDLYSEKHYLQNNNKGLLNQENMTLWVTVMRSPSIDSHGPWKLRKKLV